MTTVAAPAIYTFAPPRELKPKVGTSIQGEGRIVFHDVTRYELHRLCVETIEKYPDVETWMELLKDWNVQEVRYTEKIVAGALFGYLWFYFKEAE